MTNDDLNEVLELWRQGKRPGKIHRITGVPVPEICRAIAAASHSMVSVRPEQYGGWGRPSLREFIVARRAFWNDWDNPDGIEQARLDYDSGTHEMFQGRDGDITLQYCRPRQMPCKPREYFSSVCL